MIVFGSKLPLKPLTCQQFHSLMSALYELPSFPVSMMTQFNQSTLLYHQKTIAYHLVQDSITDVIYHEPTHEVYLNFDQRNASDRLLVLDALYEKDWFVQTSFLPLKDCAHVLKEPLHEVPTDLPCLQFAKNSISEKGIQACAEQLKGMVHVVVEENSTSQQIIAHLYHHDLMRFCPMKSESEEAFVHRMVMKLQGYMSKRVFEMPFSMKGFHQEVLQAVIQQSKEMENDVLESLDEKLNGLQLDKQRIIDQIEQMTWQIDRLSHQVQVLQQRCNARTHIPLLLKGQEKEKYPGEQKDLVLDVLKEELKTQKDEHMCSLLHEILRENPEVGHRKKLLDEIFRILVSNSQVDEKVVNDLRKIGIDLKKKTENHYKGCFFEDTRYLTSISSTPSDVNAGRQIYRDLRNFYF